MKTAIKIKKIFKLCLLVILSLSLSLIPLSGLTQNSSITDKSAIVIDGREIFFIGGLENLSAAERATIINKAIEKEIKSPQAAELEIIQANQQTVIRSKNDERHLVTVTKSDVIEAPNVFSQAIIWQQRLSFGIARAKLERSSTYLSQSLLYVISVFLCAITFHYFFKFLAKYLNRKILFLVEKNFSKFHPWQEQLKLLLKLTILGMQGGLWIAVMYYITDILPIARGLRYQLINFLSSPIFTLGKSDYSAIGLVLLLGFTILVWFIAKAITELFKVYLLSQTGVDARAQEVIGVASQYVITFFSLIILWQLWGLDVGSLTILASVLGVGIGFGLQNIANDFISGLIITLERPIQLGDFVNVGELVGTVERIGSRSTEIRTLDHVSIIVPNSRFLVNEVINWTHNDPISRIKIPVGVAYGSDVDRLKMALLEAARSHPDVLLRPRPQVWFKQFGDSSLNFELLIWTGDPKKQYILKSDLNYRIEAALRRYEIEIPFPQRDLHLRSPQLDLLINTMLEKNGVKISEEKTDLPKKNIEKISSFSTVPNTYLKSLEPIENRLSASEIERIIEEMKKDLEIKDRRYRLTNYSNCFIGSEAVDWLMDNQKWSKEEALDFGEFLQEKKIIHHVTNAHKFEDGYYFYRFS